MLVNLILRPEAFEPALFDTPGYFENALTLLRGILQNGLVLVDPEQNLRGRLIDAVKSIQNRYGQRLQALVAEICKPDKARSRIVRIDPNHFTAQAATGDTVARLRAIGLADAVVAEPAWATTQTPAADLLPLSEYTASNLEVMRIYMASELPPMGAVAGGNPHGLSFESLIIRATRFSRVLRFYDKQIGKMNRLRYFRLGIERIVELWTQNAHFPAGDLRVELYTVCDHSDPDDCTEKINTEIIKPLRARFPIRDYSLHLKTDNLHRFHARYLQTQCVSLGFDRGFDIMKTNDEIVPNLFVKLGGNCLDYLDDFRRAPAPKSKTR
ncbi:MAG: hypothetical protein K8U57_20180 [Planctomycetes bacterium]|nr:hypothetical protein [Planctomycetota bacterium]